MGAIERLLYRIVIISWDGDNSIKGCFDFRCTLFFSLNSKFAEYLDNSLKY